MGEALFDVPQPAAAPGVAAGSSDDLVAMLLATELFRTQHALTPRKIELGKIEVAMRALVEAKGVLSTAVLAQRAGGTACPRGRLRHHPAGGRRTAPARRERRAAPGTDRQR